MWNRSLYFFVAVMLAAIAVGRLAVGEEVKCEGTIAKIEGEKVTVKGASQEYQMKVEPATKIIIVGKPGSPMDLKVGQRVKCLCERKDGGMICTTLEVMKDGDKT